MLNFEASMIDQLGPFLGWENGTQLLRSSCAAHIAWMYRRLQYWSSIAGNGIYEMVMNLPKSSQKRLLLAPRLCYMFGVITQPTQEDLQQVDAFIQAERYVSGEILPTNENWTALGDVFFQPTASEGLRAWCPGQRYDAPRVRHIVLDAFSPIWNIRGPEEWGDFEMHAFEDLQPIQERIEGILTFVESTNAIAAQTIGASIQSIALVKVAQNYNLTGGASLRPMIGRIMLTNSLSERWIVANLTDRILHEAIHSLIYKIELSSSLYTNQKAAQELTVVSPWSGRNLFLHSFVHACFVWYGLWRFWNMTDIGRPENHRYWEQARRGFLPGCPLSHLGSEAYACVEPEVRHAIEDMSQRVH